MHYFFIFNLLWKGVTPYHRKVPVFHHNYTKEKSEFFFAVFCVIYSTLENFYLVVKISHLAVLIKIWVLGILVRRRKNLIHLDKKSFFWKHFFQRLYLTVSFERVALPFTASLISVYNILLHSATVSLNFFVIKIVVRMYFSVNSCTLTIIYQLSESMMLQC